MQVDNGRNARAKVIRRRVLISSRILTRSHMIAGGKMALGGLVVKNAHTEAELLLTRKVKTLPAEIPH